jgi:hypothetical protein
MPLSYWTPSEIRDLHDTELKLDSSVANIDAASVGTAAKGMDTGDNDRFIQTHWESSGDRSFIPYAKGGSDAWVKPETKLTLNWYQNGRELSRFPNSNLKNSQHYKKEGLTWTYAKETGRRFGYFPPGGAFDGKGSMFFSDRVDPWTLMAALNSELYHNLFLSLTPERDWQVGDVGRVPWADSLENTALSELAEQQYKLALEAAFSEPTSPHYRAPELCPVADEFFYDHLYTDSEYEIDSEVARIPSASEGIQNISRKAKKNEIRRKNELETVSNRIDELVYDTIGVDADVRETLKKEIFLRTSESLEDREVPDPESVPEVPDNHSF